MTAGMLTSTEVCGTLMIDLGTLDRLAHAGDIRPEGGGERGRKRRWHQADLGVLAVCHELQRAGANPQMLGRVVRYLHELQQVPGYAWLAVSPEHGPRVVTPDRLAEILGSWGEAAIVLNLAAVRRLLALRAGSERP